MVLMRIVFRGSSVAISATVSAEAISAFRCDGAVVLRGVISAPQIALLRTGIDASLAQPSPRSKVASSAADPGLFIEDFRCWQENPAYERFIFESALGAIAGELTSSQQIRLHHDHMLTKEPGTVQRTLWHQDQPYYNLEGMQSCSFWIPVDPVSRASTLEFLAGSHLGPWLMPRTFLTREARWFPEGALAEMPDIDANREKFPIIGWQMEPGDVVAFHMLTLHAAAGVEPGRRRRVFSVRVIGDDIRHAPRPWATSPDFPGLAQELPAGAPFDHPLFPVLWTREAP